MKTKFSNSEKGAVLSEYAIVVAILSIIFLAAGTMFFQSATARSNIGAEAIQNSVPCSSVSGEGALDADSPDCL